MRIAIIGAGGVGGYFGARLALAGEDVHFVARGAQLAVMRAAGLRVRRDGGDLEVRAVRATDDPAAIGPVDAVLIAVKLWDTESAAGLARTLTGAETAVVSLQNGVRKDDTLRAVLGAGNVLGGVCYISAFIEAPGVIRQVGSMQKIVLGEYDGRASARARALLASLERAGIDAALSDSVARAIWEKFVFLACLAGTTSAIRLPIGAIRGNPATRALFRDALAEVVAVARAEGVALTDAFVDDRMAFADSLPATMTSSMHGDLEHGRRLELDWLSGDVVARGRRLGVPTPVHRALNDVLVLHAAGRA
ncbi:MAG: 2-dehydropantoate 2-reductase [Burkholderiales bacterium]